MVSSMSRHTDTTGAPIPFSTGEQQILADVGLALYRGKFILNAQPPITSEQVTEIADMFGQPVPETLLELWRVAYGGEFDYNLTIPLGEHAYNASFVELFYPGSDRYRDLPGWIEAEQDAAFEQCQPGEDPRPPRYFPFGGFEYLERFYVDTNPELLGTVVVWAQGLPPSWKGRLNQDAVGNVCADIASLFDMFGLNTDPRTAQADSYPKGLKTLELIDQVRESSPNLADRLEELMAATIVDARGIVSTQKFDDSHRLREAGRLGWVLAADENDVVFAEALLTNGYPTDRVISQIFTPLTYAMARGATDVANQLLDSGVPTGSGAVVFIKDADVALIDRLIAADVEFDIEAVVSAATSGAIDVALAVARNARRAGEWNDVEEMLLTRANRERETADKVKAKQMVSYATPERHREIAAGLETVAERLRAE